METVIVNNLTAIYWIKDEARYIPEWIEFHLLQGYDHFILYDNGSTDNVFEIAKPYTDAGLLEFRFYPPGLEQAKNFWLAEECCKEQRGKSKWIDFRSLDERVFCPTGRLVTEFLKDYEQYGGVAVAWEEFGFNGHKTRPKGLLIENYTQTCMFMKKVVLPLQRILLQFLVLGHHLTIASKRLKLTIITLLVKKNLI